MVNDIYYKNTGVILNKYLNEFSGGINSNGWNITKNSKGSNILYSRTFGCSRNMYDLEIDNANLAINLFFNKLEKLKIGIENLDLSIYYSDNLNIKDYVLKDNTGLLSFKKNEYQYFTLSSWYSNKLKNKKFKMYKVENKFTYKYNQKYFVLKIQSGTNLL